MIEPTEEWLIAINEKFRKADIPPKGRPFLALEAFSKEFKCSIIIPSETINTIFEWFYKNTKEGSHSMGPLYRGVYYFDSCFWPVYILDQFGQCKINAFDSLQTMPINFKEQIKADKKQSWDFFLLWVNCLDYAWGYEDIIVKKKFQGLSLNFIKSADKELRAAASLLLQETPEVKAIESARMAVEMFLKAVLIIANNWGEDEIKKKIGHNLVRAAQEAFNSTQSQEIKAIEKYLSIYPEIHERYSGKDWKARDLWKGYCIVQAVAATFTRLYSERDARQQVFRKGD
ncbi:MAG: hypothetical protein PHC37_02060 [Candidatus Omnitrophica bacterium]|nr:hypothetical protein [Candidatus Omnitrophota bacterium]MDD5690471.1 hypothetical protein [Candidatus Omnitrophota bacterium]